MFEVFNLSKPSLAVCGFVRQPPEIGGGFDYRPLVFGAQMHLKEFIVSAVNYPVNFGANLQ
jgi:hypothetical protein